MDHESRGICNENVNDHPADAEYPLMRDHTVYGEPVVYLHTRIVRGVLRA